MFAVSTAHSLIFPKLTLLWYAHSDSTFDIKYCIGMTSNLKPYERLNHFGGENMKLNSYTLPGILFTLRVRW